VGVLIALRTAPEFLPLGEDPKHHPSVAMTYFLQTEKRNKRPRVPSPTAAPVSAVPTATTNSRSMSITLPARNSVGPSPTIPFSRDPKARREALSKQLPLQEGRKVAFHPPPGKAGGADDENTWILALVTKCIHADKNRYLALHLRICIYTLPCLDMKYRTLNLKKTDRQACEFPFYVLNFRAYHSLVYTIPH
jgi:SAGA-associated factor 29